MFFWKKTERKHDIQYVRVGIGNFPKTKSGGNK